MISFAGAQVWVTDKDQSWVLGKVVALVGDAVTVRVAGELADRSLKVADVHRANSKIQGGAEVRAPSRWVTLRAR